MNEAQLEQMKSKKGFIAALDQSGGSTPKALKLYGVEESSYHSDEEMYQVVHKMRTRIIKSAAFSSEHIIGAILFENTMERKIDGDFSADYLWDKKGIVPFLKIDKGLDTEKNGVQLMKDMPELDALLTKAVTHHVFGTKMRSVIHRANEEGIKAIVEQQYEIAEKILSYGLVPIIEPEVDILSPEKQECEEILREMLLEGLKKLSEKDEVIFKLSIPSIDGFYSDLMNAPHVVRVVALSGGYSRSDANEKLYRNPGLIASFSRALSEGLNVKQSEEEFDKTLNNSIVDIYQASIS